jgi:hypothetical protein
MTLAKFVYASAVMKSPVFPQRPGFLASRVQGHTRLSVGSWLDTRAFAGGAAGFKSLGAAAFARHVKTRKDDPWWPTAEPIALDGLPLSDRDRIIDGALVARGRNLAQDMIDEAHAQGMKMAAYYWHMSEESLVESPELDLNLYKDWICRHYDGTPIVGPQKQGTELDITGPYRELVVKRLLELAAMGVDGLFFDERHLPAPGCWGSALEQAWTVATGRPAPPRNDADPLYRQFVDFKAQQIEETFIYWRDTVKARYPHVVFIVSTTTIPALTNREMTTRLASIADSAKNEYRHALNNNFNKNVFENNPDLAVPPDHVRQALGWTVLRDAADGRPPHIWAPGLPDIHHARAYAASLLTFGCIANMDVEESVLGGGKAGPGKTPIDALQAAFTLGAKASPHLGTALPIRWAAVHFSERNRDDRGDDYRAAWQEVLWPLTGMYQVLCEQGLPVGIVNDRQLEHSGLHAHRLLLLPNPNLTPVQHRAVLAFAGAGGVVIHNDSNWRWSDPAGTTIAAAAFRKVIGRYANDAPVRVRGGPPGRYAVSYDNKGKLVVAVTNDFSWVQITNRNNIPPSINLPPRAAAGVEVAWRQGVPRILGPDLRFQATEAITGIRLRIERSPGVYKVKLPPIDSMALVVVNAVAG